MQKTDYEFPTEFHSLLEWIHESQLENVSLELVRHRVTRAAQALMERTAEWSERAWNALLEIYVHLERDLVPVELFRRLYTEWSPQERQLRRVVLSLGSLNLLASGYRQLAVPMAMTA